jgi:hypothetical protein
VVLSIGLLSVDFTYWRVFFYADSGKVLIFICGMVEIKLFSYCIKLCDVSTVTYKGGYFDTVAYGSNYRLSTHRQVEFCR